MNTNKQAITCPNCHKAIDVNEVLYRQMQERMNDEWQKKEESMLFHIQKQQDEMTIQQKLLLDEKKKMHESIAQQLAAQLKAEREIITQELRKKLNEEKEDQIKLMQRELQDQQESLREMNKLKAEMERVVREKETLSETITLQKEKELSEKLREEKTKMKQQAEEEQMLKLKEREKIIEDLKTQMEVMKRKAEQGSMQLQGEVQELVLEELLRTDYPYDEISEISKGVRGADVLQTVNTRQGERCGLIYYESKRTKHFESKWITKLKEDNLVVKADVLVLVTEAMPEDKKKLFYREGVWICSFFEVKGLSMVLRHMLYELKNSKTVSLNRETKMEMLYNYFTGNEFKGQFEALIEGFSDLQKGYQDERLRMQKIWKEREKQLERILTNAVGFYGSLKGIAGSSIPDIKYLEGGGAELPE
ncbi:MAG: DUF2130 domain-containing protein [Bacteroidetes bacterium]|nr:DUF2130 domain-containing protein [Bacteroidota bacterium]